MNEINEIAKISKDWKNWESIPMVSPGVNDDLMKHIDDDGAQSKIKLVLKGLWLHLLLHIQD